MPKKAILALATLIVFGSASAALAESNNGTNHRGPVVWGRTSPTMFEQRNATTSHAVKPFTAEGKGLVRPREPRLLKRLLPSPNLAVHFSTYCRCTMFSSRPLSSPEAHQIAVCSIERTCRLYALSLLPAPSAGNANAMIAAITLVDMVVFSSCRKRRFCRLDWARC